MNVKLLLALLVFFLASCLTATARANVGDVGKWGDQGNGTYINPVLPADYSDIDAIRVGGTYYAIASTFQFSPGETILRSKDLVNWTIAGHAVSDLNQISKQLNWKHMNRYGRGIWAGAIRYHDHQFWIYFGTPNEGYFMTTARHASGPWAPLHQVLKGPGWDDCCPIWVRKRGGHGAQGYLVGTSFAQHYKIHLFKLTANGEHLEKGFDKVIHQSPGSEANKLYRIHGWFYHIYSDTRTGQRVVMAERSRRLTGPWQTRQLNHVNPRVDFAPNQGGIVQIPDGNWWFFTQQGTGNWAGREDCLLPVTWINSWPIIGRVGRDGIGNMVWQHKKPINGFPMVTPQTSDNFNKNMLAVQWQWNYQPRNSKWSLTQRPGWLRLHAFRPLQKGNLWKAGNTLTQCSMNAQHCLVTMKMDISGMANGQQAGLCHFGHTYSTLGLHKSRGRTRLIFNNNGKITPGPLVHSAIIYLRSAWGQHAHSRYFYSLNGKHFKRFGGMYKLTWGNYRGDRIGIFCYNNRGPAGHVDVDWFHYTFDGPGNRRSGGR